ncbi:MAG: NUDIX domain-containing protein [Planctomycetales bacterium]|nr:NUDIX domain-containing protein [Planctomycetales bacterium]
MSKREHKISEAAVHGDSSGSGSSPAPRRAQHRRGAVAVIVREQKLLLIQRAPTVVAPGAYCFPGGGIEAGETEPQALVRELCEELAVRVVPRERLWRSVTAWGVELAWWLAELPAEERLVANPAEVARFQWMTVSQMRRLDGLLSSNHAFLAALAAGEFVIQGITERRRPRVDCD